MENLWCIWCEHDLSLEAPVAPPSGQLEKSMCLVTAVFDDFLSRLYIGLCLYCIDINYWSNISQNTNLWWVRVNTTLVRKLLVVPSSGQGEESVWQVTGVLEDFLIPIQIGPSWYDIRHWSSISHKTNIGLYRTLISMKISNINAPIKICPFCFSSPALYSNCSSCSTAGAIAVASSVFVASLTFKEKCY